MSVAELKLLAILAMVFGICSSARVRSVGRIAMIFVFACSVGFVAQLPLGPDLNLYTPNITHYVSYVSVAVIITWGIGLAGPFIVHLWTARRLRTSPGLGLYLGCGIPILVVLECIGSNVVRMKIHNYKTYTSLIPYLNAMNAPVWLYAYYIAVGLLFYAFMLAIENRLAAPAETPHSVVEGIRAMARSNVSSD
jgi:hypothetical protein